MDKPIKITEEAVEAIVNLPAKKWYALTPRTREIAVTALMVGAAVYVANRLSSPSAPSTINVETVTL